MPGLTDAPLAFVVARKAAVISFRAYPPASELAHLPKVQSAAIDCLSELRGSFDVYVTPGMREGAIEVSIGRTGQAALAACVFRATALPDEVRRRLAVIVERLASVEA